MDPLVSILIPAFNAEKWIAACIESALVQTWRKKEIIVVDDGSTDSTARIARAFASPIVKVVSQPNRGAGTARNRALDLARGEYIQWLDADDLLSPEKIARQIESADAGADPRILFSGAWGTFYCRPNRAKFNPDALWRDLSPVEWLYRKIGQNLWMPPACWLVSRKLTEISGPWDVGLSLDDDGEYFSRIISSSSSVKFVRKSRCFKRQATFGLSHQLTFDDEKLESQLESLTHQMQRLRFLEDTPRTREACIELLNRWAIHFYPERPDLMDHFQTMAKELGGGIFPPRLRPKYRFLEKLLGFKTAKKAQYLIPAIRSVAEKNIERFQTSSKHCL